MGVIWGCYIIREELSYNAKKMGELHAAMFDSLNADQRAIYDKVMNAVNKQTGEFFFIYGAGGTGKTYLYKTIMAHIRSQGNIVLVVASSGIASLLLPGGRTAHNRFLIPIELLDNSTCGIKQNNQLAHLMQEVKLIIWDEAPMTHRNTFEALNRTLQDIQSIKHGNNKHKLFGGITVLLGGDFRQILPVITKGKRQDIVQACISNSPIWSHCQVLTLTKSIRVNDQQANGEIDIHKQQFNKWIQKIGDGNAEAIALDNEEEETWTEIPQEFIIGLGTDLIAQLIAKVFPYFMANETNPSYLQDRAILTPLNEDADQINRYMFNRLHGQMRTYKSADEICKASTDVAEQEHFYPPEFLNNQDFHGIPPHVLELKEGLSVMLLRNVNPSQGLCNGTHLIITHLGDWVVEAEIITGTCVGNRVLIPRITLNATQSKWPFVMKRRQFPLKSCYAMTINKSQGQSLKHVGLYLPRPVFCHGQLYVAVSRVTHPQGLSVLLLPTGKEPANYARNIVFKEAFNHLATEMNV